ncbi:protein of unknown function [Candidatus Methylocalor cossyra]|uniref:Uncharacterized protein n=1 Tax=Candidatus Methylocalor cossyra TaxID=3108543 RepID=A0ABM9NJU9_9GAMM
MTWTLRSVDPRRLGSREENPGAPATPGLPGFERPRVFAHDPDGGRYPFFGPKARRSSHR